ncbi:MAG: DUF177 domain-containing protein [Rhodothermaceae bacterium]|nr:DUF177 domain-containing protein [Rhodothermaceae bacterium]
MVKIDLKALKAGIHEYDWVLTAETLEIDPEMFGEEIELYVRLDYHASRVLVNIQVDTVARLVCDRTLAGYEQPVQGEYNLLFSGPEMFEGMEEEEEDIQLLATDVEEIDLTDFIRDTLLLSLPQRRIAPGAEDEEIPLRFGEPDAAEGRIDPRWEALRALKDGSSDNA